MLNDIYFSTLVAKVYPFLDDVDSKGGKASAPTGQGRADALQRPKVQYNLQFNRTETYCVYVRFLAGS